MTDAQLIERAQQGDRQAWQTLYERLFPSVWRKAMLRLNDRAVAEDMVAETFLTLVRRLPTLDASECRIYGWVHKVLHDHTVDYLRRQSRHAKSLNHLAENSANGESPSDNPLASALTEERRGQVRQVLLEMRDDQQLVLELKYADHLSVEQIAERTGTTKKAAESLLYRARQEFRRRFELCSRDTKSAVAPPLSTSDDTPLVSNKSL